VKRRSQTLVFTLIVVLAALAALAVLVPSGVRLVAQGSGSADWRTYAGTNANGKYSPLDQINKNTVRNLRIVWRQSATPVEARRGVNAPAPTNYQSTPLMVGGLLYMSAGNGTVVALDAVTGKVAWSEASPQNPGSPPRGNVIRHDEPGQPGVIVVSGRALASRGLAYWTDGRDARVITVVGPSLVAVNAKTGQHYPDFGGGGFVDLTKGLDRPVEAYRWGGPPLVVGDVIVVGGIMTAGGLSQPGDIRGYNVRTGALLWTFHTIPRPGEFGTDTWLKGSERSGAAGVWTGMTADDELGYIYLPTESVASQAQDGDFYGGRRPGPSLFEDSLLCLDAKTGKRVWHFQLVHHGLWDWDAPTGPNLLDIMVDGRRIKAVAQVTKQGFVYTFDRVTGAPVWPIEERAVPSGNVPGEWYSPTQPHPTKPPAYEAQEVTTEELVDFTPELRQEALKIVSHYKYGSLFMPPSVSESGPGGTRGTIQRMGTVSTTWNGAGVDPDTAILYVPSVQNPGILEMVKAPDAKNDWITNPLTLAYGPYLEGPRGLPTPFKPPYGRFTAIDMNKGSILWSVANGNGPRDNPAIKHLKLPPLGQGGRASPLVTKTMVFLGEGGNDGVAGLPPGGGGKMFRAYDKASGKVVWEMELPGGTTGEPMTYMVNGKQFIVVAVGWRDTPGELIALALP
jgi:quinoprotein glucose dehydrogenase